MGGKHRPNEDIGKGTKDGSFLWLMASFCTLVLVLDFAIWYLSREEYLVFLETFTATSVTKLLHMSGLPATTEGNTIYLTNSVWIVTTECAALFVMSIFTSFVLAYRASLGAKGIALLAGIPFIFFANIARLYAMAWIDRIKPEYLEYFHNYVWQVVFIVMVVVMWLFWIDKVVGRESRTPLPS